MPGQSASLPRRSVKVFSCQHLEVVKGPMVEVVVEAMDSPVVAAMMEMVKVAQVVKVAEVLVGIVQKSILHLNVLS